jgi:hypothetical protein
MAEHDKMAALILAKGKPKEDEDDKPDEDAALHQAMEDFARAVHQTPPDLRGMMGSFRAAFDIMDCEPDADDEGGE